MKFFFPDSQDFVDPSFDFESETRSDSRVRQRDDLYPHEIFNSPPYDGVLVSKAIVEGIGGQGRYSMAQRHRLLRVGVPRFFRLEGGRLETMGDCGAFSYVKEEIPPFTPEEVVDFYEQCQFDYGLSVDHVILGFSERFDRSLPGIDGVPDEWTRRRELTIELAAEFWNAAKSERHRFTPIGVAQGWSPTSYARSVEELQKIGYRLIALGGLVPLSTVDILKSLRRVDEIRRPDTGLHLLGITRYEHVKDFQSLGVVSFDSTSPLRQAFKDEHDNYYLPQGALPAIRLPQVDGNPKLKKKIIAGVVDQNEALILEQQCIKALCAFDRDEAGLESALEAVMQYADLLEPGKDWSQLYREVLDKRPWKKCPCEICQSIGIHVILFRGAERNRRRGFHNLYVFYRRLQTQIDSVELHQAANL